MSNKQDDNPSLCNNGARNNTVDLNISPSLKKITKNEVKVVLVDPVPLSFSSPSLIKGNTLEPYACQVLAAALDDIVENAIKTDNKGNIIEENVKVLQSEGDNEYELVQSIIAETPDVVGFSVRTCYYTRAARMAHCVKKEFPDVLIIFGGYHPSIDPINTLGEDGNVDIAIVGEGEETLREIVKKFSKPNKLEQYKDIPGAFVKGYIECFKRRNRITSEKWEEYTPNYKNHRNLSEIISKCRNWNLSYPSSLEQNGVAQIQTQRGCPFHCSFCCTPNVWGEYNALSEQPAHKHFKCGPSQVTKRNPKDVVNEIEDICRDFNYKTKKDLNFFYFNDVTFNIYYEQNGTSDYHHVKELCENLINKFGESKDENRIVKKFNWFCLCGIPRDKESAEAFLKVLPLMAQAGCSKIGFGIESVSEVVQLEYNKKLQKEIIKSVLATSWEAGIINRVYLIIGAPDENEDTFNDTKLFLLNEDVYVDQIRVAFAVPFPGTTSAEKWKDSIYNPANLDEYTEDIPIVKCKLGEKEELIQKRKSLIEDFYKSKMYKSRVCQKVSKFPFLRQSYIVFFNELYQISGFSIDLRDFNFENK